MKDVDGVKKAVMKPAGARWRSSAATRQRGASLLEAIAYLGIAALVVIGAIALLTSAFSSANTNAVSEQISAIQTGVKKLYSGQNASYSGLTNTVLASAGVFPASFSPASDGSVTNTWNGTVTVAVASSPDEFTITYTDVPQNVCVNAVSAGGSWMAISVNGTALTLPATPADASADCSSTSANTIVWTST
ncbi:type 4 pilus major pilin [Paraburkholderia sediminicola]|uniref:type 4 pilus major pilin n=1 Tax=Paraburkholderia sediminicola TaxID=458836 RepID=UPI0038BDC25B